MGRITDNLFSVVVVAACIVKKGKAPGPFFLFSDGSWLMMEKLTGIMRDELGKLGVPKKHFARHSFRIGAVTVHGHPS